MHPFYFAFYTSTLFEANVHLHLYACEPGLSLSPLGERSVLGKILAPDTISHKATFVPHLLIDVAVPLGEAPALGNVDLLTAGELELGATESLDSLVLVFVGGTDRHEGLTDTDASNQTLGLAESSSHSSLK